MMLIFGLMLLLLQTAAYKLSLQMVLDIQDQELYLYKRENTGDEQIALSIKNNKVTKHEYVRNRSEFIHDNGTLIINSVIGADLGIYSLVLYDSHDSITFRGDLLVNVEGLDRFCWFDQSDPCYAALGHKLNLPMVLDARNENLKFYKEFKNRTTLDVFKLQNNEEYIHESIRNRSEFIFENGTLIINHVIRADSGTYGFRRRVSDMVMFGDLQVIVEAPIGPVEVSISCSSSGVMRVFCSSEGDQLLYSWTLNADPLMDGNSSIDLDEETDGNISCSVKNHVSHAQKPVRLVCPAGPDRFCWFNQSDPCYAALGHKLYLQMVLDARDQDLYLYKEFNDATGLEVFRVKNNKLYKHESISNRSEFFVHNGTLIINNVTEADLGTYRLELYDSDGTRTIIKHLAVNTEVCSVSVVFVLVWGFQLMVLLGLLGGFHIYMRHTSGKKQEDQKVRMRRFRD